MARSHNNPKELNMEKKLHITSHYTAVSGKFPDGYFLDGHFPDGLFSKESSPNGQFPDMQLPEWHFPERTFPRMNISPNHVFYFRSKIVIDMNKVNLM